MCNVGRDAHNGGELLTLAEEEWEIRHIVMHLDVEVHSCHPVEVFDVLLHHGAIGLRQPQSGFFFAFYPLEGCGVPAVAAPVHAEVRGDGKALGVDETVAEIHLHTDGGGVVVDRLLEVAPGGIAHAKHVALAHLWLTIFDGSTYAEPLVATCESGSEGEEAVEIILDGRSGEKSAQTDKQSVADVARGDGGCGRQPHLLKILAGEVFPLLKLLVGFAAVGLLIDGSKLLGVEVAVIFQSVIGIDAGHSAVEVALEATAHQFEQVELQLVIAQTLPCEQRRIGRGKRAAARHSSLRTKVDLHLAGSLLLRRRQD